MSLQRTVRFVHVGSASRLLHTLLGVSSDYELIENRNMRKACVLLVIVTKHFYCFPNCRHCPGFPAAKGEFY